MFDRQKIHFKFSFVAGSSDSTDDIMFAGISYWSSDFQFVPFIRETGQ